MKSRVSTSKRLLLINTGATLVSKVLSITVLVWVQQFLIKNIPVEEYALLPLVFSMIFFLPFLTYVLTGGLKRYVMEAYAKHQDEQISKICSSMFPFFFLGSLILFLIGGLISWKIDTLLNIEPEYVETARLMFFLVISLEALRLTANLFSNGLFVKQRFVLQSSIKLVSEVFKLILMLAFLFGVSISVMSVVAAVFITGFIEMFVFLFVSLKILPEQKFKRIEVDWKLIKEITALGSWSSLYGFSETIRKAADPIILNRLSTPTEVASFHLGALIPNRLEMLVNQSYMSTVSPQVIAHHAQSNEQKLKNIYLRSGRILLWALMLLICPFIVHHEQIVILYVGSEFASAGIALVLLLGCAPFIYGNILQRPLASAKKRIRSLAFRELFSAVINLSLTFLFVGFYNMGAIGSAMATFLVYGIGSLFVFWPFGKSMVNATWGEVWVDIMFPGIVPFIFAAGAMYGILQLYPALTWLDLAINAFFGTMVYFFVMWFTMKDIDKAELKSALTMLYSSLRRE